MKLSDIVNQMFTLLPQLTGKFTNDISVDSMTRNGTVITVQCKEKHELKVNEAVAFIDSDIPIVISLLTRSGVVGTLVCATNQDLSNLIAETIRITGATESEFNGTFTRLNVDNRKTITFTMADSGATTATGSPVLRDASGDLNTYNSTYLVSEILNDSSFNFIHPTTTLANPDGTIIARTNPRISATVDIDSAIASYTKQEIDKLWAFVVLGDVVASIARTHDTDAIAIIPKNSNYRQQIIEPFSVYVFIPVENEIAAREARDVIHDITRPIFRSLLFTQFDTGLYASNLNSVVFAGHGQHSYDKAVYIHEFLFQQATDIYEEDTVGHDLDVRFNDLDFSIFLDFGTQVNFMSASIDLDDTPLT